MTIQPNGAMGEILALTKAGRLAAATTLIKQTLAGSPPVASETDPAPENAPALPSPAAAQEKAARRPAASPRETRKTYSRTRGKLDYLLYVPQSLAAQSPPPLLVMLHGCTQSADDFARGTRMNALAEELGFIVAYPEQTASANQQKCWNWFRPGDQGRDAGEPALIAGIVRDVIAEHGADPARVYVAGLSAGGAAAAIMAAAYPDLFAAVGIHSGLACGSARDLPGALAAMQGRGRKRIATPREYVPVITFHGERDSTVHPDNSDQIHAAFVRSPRLAGLRRDLQEGKSAGGRSFRRLALVDGDGRSLAEDWRIAGAGHAWSGGAAEGSYTDPKGPDASREMLRFFLQHRLPG